MALRVDQAARVIPASPGRLWQAWVDPDELAQWMAPPGMRARIKAMDPRPGGMFRAEMIYADATGAPGKTAPDRDLFEARYATLDPPHALVLEVQFQSDDPAFAGVMQLEWRYVPVAGGTKVILTARDVPPGIAQADHQAGMTATLDNLARHVAAHPD